MESGRVSTADPSTSSRRRKVRLRRLRTDRIDLYYQHRVDPTLPIEEVAAKLTLNLRRAGRLTNPDPGRVTMVEGDVLDRPTLEATMKGQEVVYASLADSMKRQAEQIVAAMHATGLKRLIFISSMGIYGEVPDEQYRSVLDPTATPRP